MFVSELLRTTVLACATCGQIQAIILIYYNIIIYIQKCNVTLFILSENCSTCFGWYHHPSSVTQITVSTVSGICHTVTAICRYSGRVGTSLSVLWVAYANCSTIAAGNNNGVANTSCCRHSCLRS
jgi:hypothetical protein